MTASLQCYAQAPKFFPDTVTNYWRYVQSLHRLVACYFSPHLPFLMLLWTSGAGKHQTTDTFLRSPARWLPVRHWRELRNLKKQKGPGFQCGTVAGGHLPLRKWTPDEQPVQNHQPLVMWHHFSRPWCLQEYNSRSTQRQHHLHFWPLSSFFLLQAPCLPFCTSNPFMSVQCTDHLTNTTLL